MDNDLPDRPRHEVQALRPGLHEADDQKIRRVLAVVDSAADPAINRALLETLRPRLAALRPARPLRLTRLLFIPLDPLTVPLRSWRTSDPTVPRPVLAPIARLVRAGIGDLALVIDGIIAGQKADAAQAITQVGELLWPRAAELLAASSPPADWLDTGLPPGAYRPLMGSIAAVLRRASQLRSLALDEEQGGLATDPVVVAEILGNVMTEPEIGSAMVARLMLQQAPHALSLLARIADSGRTAEQKAQLCRAMNSALQAVLCDLEQGHGFTREIAYGALPEAGRAVRRVTTLLEEIEADKSFSDHWPRLQGIREKLDAASATRFASGINEGLIASLGATTAPLDGDRQTALETCARNLRKLEMTARKLGDPGGYDALLQKAADAVMTAADAGILTSMRKYRLIEILAGPEAAEKLYFKALRVSGVAT